jgi:uncharacterized cupredoxin-like copper-binding protein
MRHRLIAVIVLPAVLALAACGSDNKSSNSAPAGGSSAGSSSSGGSALTVSESEFKIVPKDATTKAGKVTITIKNTGKFPHALALEGAGPGGQDIKSDTVMPGQTGTVTATLKAGKVEWYCPIDGHKSKGMVGDLTVS